MTVGLTARRRVTKAVGKWRQADHLAPERLKLRRRVRPPVRVTVGPPRYGRSCLKKRALPASLPRQKRAAVRGAYAERSGR
jgi:hypothetical protein